MLTEKLSIFENPSFDDSIAGEEIHTYHPTSNSFNNNDEIEIVINNNDALILMNESALYIEGTVDISATGKGTVKVVNNFGAFLFEYLTYELNGIEIDRVRDPGIVTLLKSYLCLNENECKSLSFAGISCPNDNNATMLQPDNSFSLRIPLPFLFGIFYDYKRVLRGKHKLRLVRARSDNNCYQVLLDAADRNAQDLKKMTINVTKVELKAKHILPTDTIKLEILKKLDSRTPILIPFRKWELHELPVLAASNKQIWTVKTSVNLERPRYVVVAFQTDRKDNVKNTNVYFDHINITDMKVFLNSHCYPYESLQLNFSNKKYAELYQMYLDFHQSFLSREPEPLISYDKFKERVLFVFDTSKYNNNNETVFSSTCDLRIEFQSSVDFPNKTKAYCLIIHDSIVEYTPLTGVVRQVT
jgi:hypothetical protein